MLRSSGLFVAGLVCSLLGEDKAFPRRAYLGSASVLLGAGFPLPFPVLAASQVSMESFGCAPFPASVPGTFPVPATLLLLDSGVYPCEISLGWLLLFPGLRKYCSGNRFPKDV